MNFTALQFRICEERTSTYTAGFIWNNASVLGQGPSETAELN